jgi:hypothetical protein
MTKKPATKATAKPSSASSGVPRTHGEAKRRGARVSKVTFSHLTDERKGQFIKLSDSGARAGSMCGIGPSNDPSKILVCYKNESGQCNWVEWPKSDPAASHD